MADPATTVTPDPHKLPKMYPVILINGGSLVPVEEFMHAHEAALDNYNLDDGSSSEPVIHASLCSDFGPFDKAEVKQMSDTILSVVGVLEAELQKFLSVKSFAACQAALMNCVVLSHAVGNSDVAESVLEKNKLFRDEATKADMNNVRRWLKAFIDDDEIYNALELGHHIPKLASLLVQSSKASIWKTILNKVQKERPILNVTVLRFPDSSSEEMLLYNIVLTMFQQAAHNRTFTRVDTTSGLVVHMNKAKFKPNLSLLKDVSADVLNSAKLVGEEVYELKNHTF